MNVHLSLALRQAQKQCGQFGRRALSSARAAPQRPRHTRQPAQGNLGPSVLSAHQVFAPLAKGRPVFKISKPISVLREPQQFYHELLHGIRHARRRICLSSLYLGSEETELVSALDRALAGNSGLQVQVLLDCLRGTRTDSAGMSSAALLAPLVRRFGAERVQVCMYHTPALSGLSKQAWPQRYNETFGLQHIKAYIFDDDVIISGANLSRDYFTNRQDRYMRISDRQFTGYFAGLVATIGKFSFRVHAGDRDARYRLEMASGVADPTREPRAFVREANELMARFLEQAEIEHAAEAGAISEHDTLAIPTVQMRQLGITQDETHMSEFFELVHAFARSHGCRSLMASAYFNFSNQYKRSVLDSASRWDLLVASPQANGFYTAKGISQFIPNMYSIIEHEFVRTASARARSDISIEEYARPGWTFHGKGVWCYLNQKLPQLTMIGSPNYGYRSIYRDLEAQVTVLPGEAQLQTDIHHEALGLLSHSKIVSQDELRQRTRGSPLWLHGLKPFIMKKM
ncbi:CDP-diacylglycerol--glycerol-3-phosphate 3-phosphatidyltransferase [Coemansia erecta]|nr:CDP-diacylglycerol--glycerol-3-phosphate 3-phosphatidyltransferase [Coemansia sp. RSA 2618]KAJ2826292.1 CDP-diacylglycerol--glycerol-3-phosphate 3-phosphatidyltransferase [Coemansia erecta]